MFFSLLHRPHPKPEDQVHWAAAPHHTDPGSGGRRSWHRGGTARCPAGSGRWAAALAHSSPRLLCNDSYIHTCACPVGRMERVKKPLVREQDPKVLCRPPSSIGDVLKDRGYVPLLFSENVMCLSRVLGQISAQMALLRGSLPDPPKWVALPTPLSHWLVYIPPVSRCSQKVPCAFLSALSIAPLSVCVQAFYCDP